MKATTMKLTDEDKAIIAGLKDRLGLRNTSDIIRQALRTLDAQGITERGGQTVKTENRVIECESCAVTGERVPATTHSVNPEFTRANMCQKCANEYDSRISTPEEPDVDADDGATMTYSEARRVWEGGEFSDWVERHRFPLTIDGATYESWEDDVEGALSDDRWDSED